MARAGHVRPGLYKGEPRGRHRVTERMRAAAAARAAGESSASIAAREGVSRKMVATWCQKVREAAEDDRNTAALASRPR